MLIYAWWPTPEMLFGPRIEMFVGTAHIANSTIRTSKLINYEGSKAFRDWVLSAKIITDFWDTKNNLNSFVCLFCKNVYVSYLICFWPYLKIHRYTEAWKNEFVVCFLYSWCLTSFYLNIFLNFILRIC